MGSLWSKEEEGNSYVSREGLVSREDFLRLATRRKSYMFLVTKRISKYSRYEQPEVAAGDGFTFLSSLKSRLERNPEWRLEISSSEGYGAWVDITLEELQLVIDEYVSLWGETDAPNNAYSTPFNLPST